MCPTSPSWPRPRNRGGLSSSWRPNLRRRRVWRMWPELSPRYAERTDKMRARKGFSEDLFGCLQNDRPLSLAIEGSTKRPRGLSPGITGRGRTFSADYPGGPGSQESGFSRFRNYVPACARSGGNIEENQSCGGGLSFSHSVIAPSLNLAVTPSICYILLVPVRSCPKLLRDSMGKNTDLQNPLPPFLVDSHAHLELEPLVAERRGSSAKSVHGAEWPTLSR